MYSISLSWKAFNVNLSVVDDWCRAEISATYQGVSASGAKLTLWFSSEPSEMQKQLIQDYWDDLTLESDAVTSYVSAQSIREAIADLRTTMIAKSWDELTIAERKILMGQTPTNEELGLA